MSRAAWLRLMHQVHWISSAVCLMCLLGFGATGITLNHAAAVGATPRVETFEGELPADLAAALAEGPDGANAPLPAPLRDWLQATLDVEVGRVPAEWSADEIYLALPRPGGDAWLAIERDGGAIVYEATDRGWIAWLNDLHKGRDSGEVWKWFIDIFAIATLLFSATGLVLLWLHSRHRPSTWKLAGLGLLLPLFLIVMFVP